MANDQNDQSPLNHAEKQHSRMSDFLRAILGLFLLLIVALAGQFGKQVARDFFGVAKPRMSRDIDELPIRSESPLQFSNTIPPEKKSGTGVKTEIHAAGATFVVSSPEGYVRLLDESSEGWREVRRFTPPRAEIAAVFVTTDDMAQILLKERPQFAQYILVTTVSDANNLNPQATRTMFAAIRKQFQSQSQTRISLDEAARKINDRLASYDDVKSGIGGSAVVEYFDVGQQTSGLVMLVNQSIDGETRIKANCTAITLIQNKIVQVTATRHYQNRGDVSEAKKDVITCVASFE